MKNRHNRGVPQYRVENTVENPKKSETLHSELVSAAEHPVPEKRGRPSPKPGETYFQICG
ncbi:unnamed protein product [marine sediment metagenome]|uniref:Uncharacterized protein n=1 Tax=marine sediment metagenome TaxID=412755 RepID=X1MUP8_9ZZZZ